MASPSFGIAGGIPLRALGAASTLARAPSSSRLVLRRFGARAPPATSPTTPAQAPFSSSVSACALSRRSLRVAGGRTRADPRQAISAPARRAQSFSSSPARPSASSSSPSPATAATAAAPPPRPSRTRRFLLATTLFTVFAATGFAMAAAPAAEAINGWVNPPTDAETIALAADLAAAHADAAHAQQINARLAAHPLAVQLRANPALTESRPHLKIPAAMRAHSLTAGVLLNAPGGLEAAPLTFLDTTAALPTLTQITYVGPALCGHPGLVHGGLLATLLDEGLARCCFPALPNQIGVTASLKIDYRVPCPAGRLLVLKAETTKVEGRKAWVKGWIELLADEGGEGEGVKMVEAEALFIEPRQAKSMARLYNSST